MHRSKLALFSICGAVLMGCAGSAGKAVSTAESTTPTGSDFSRSLHREYVDIAKRELAEADPESAEYYANKAVAAASGRAVAPDDFTTYRVHREYEPQLREARSKLVAALNSPAAARRPDLAAQAQANFDCWMQEAAEPWWQPEDRKFCQTNMDKALAELGAAQTAAAPPAAAPVEEFLVFFDFNSARLTPEAHEIVRSAAAVATRGGNPSLVLVGHADRAGPPDYNLALSRERADSVKAALVRLGVPGSNIQVEAKGESDPLIPTADGVAEPQNRRVQITVN
jgi:OmpA-OmpF porin, OOP family